MKFAAVLSIVGALALAQVGFAAAENAAAVSPSEVQTYERGVDAELRGDILKFWLDHARDRERGGFYGQIDGDLTVHKKAPRAALLTARILWTFSAAYRRYHEPEYLAMARWAYEDLEKNFWDKQHGGLYWTITADGKPLNARKLAYVQSFGIYGLSEYFRASGERAALDRAIELYRLLDTKGHDAKNGGYFEEFTADWAVSRERGRRSAMGSLDQKSQNVHLHILEALTNLYRVWPDAGLQARFREVVDVMMTRVLDTKTHHLRLFLGEDWTPRSDTMSFGHDIEFSWLIVEAADVLGDKALGDQVRAEAVRIADVTLQQGVDPDGGVLGEAGPHGLTVTFKEWWPQAEATVGFLNAYQISGDARFFAASRHTWEFIDRVLVDHERGEWHRGVSRDGKYKATVKVDPWKCPYHNGRACLELTERLHELETKP